MKVIYFVIHAKPDFSIKDELLRPLSEEGINDSRKVTEYLKDKNITKIYSSPYKRSIDTIRDFAIFANKGIELVEDFRERKVSNNWIKDFNKFVEKQWSDFNYTLEEGENLRVVQDRNIEALHKLLNENNNENILIGTHGTALSTIINYYDKSFDYKSFNKIKDIMPLIVVIKFEGINVNSIEYVLNI